MKPEDSILEHSVHIKALLLQEVLSDSSLGQHFLDHIPSTLSVLHRYNDNTSIPFQFFNLLTSLYGQSEDLTITSVLFCFIFCLYYLVIFELLLVSHM